MTLEKAIAIITKGIINDQTVRYEDMKEAAKLGIEALKCVREIRHHPFPDTVLKLPGETE